MLVSVFGGHSDRVTSLSQTSLGSSLRRLSPIVIKRQVSRSERARSALLPLHERLIVAADGEEVCVVVGEHDTDDVLGVTAV